MNQVRHKQQKRLKLQLENVELWMFMARLEKEQAEFHTDKESFVPLLSPLETDEQDVNDSKGDNNDIEDVEVMEGARCCYPGCLFSMISVSGMQIDECHGSFEKVIKFHHRCNMSWLESKGVTDAEFKKLCIDCVCRQYI